MGNISLDKIPKEETKNFYRIKELIDLSTNYNKLVIRDSINSEASFKQFSEINYLKMNEFVSEIKRYINLKSSTQ